MRRHGTKLSHDITTNKPKNKMHSRNIVIDKTEALLGTTIKTQDRHRRRREVHQQTPSARVGTPGIHALALPVRA
jgi:hypothetical protein